MNELKVFSNEQFGSIRGVEIDGESWLVGKDVAERLGYKNPNEAIADHVDDEDKLNSKTLLSCEQGDKLNDKTSSSLGQRGGWLINESGFYSLVLGSKLPNAKQFKHWVTSEVLPAIRKHGGYLSAEKVEEALLNPDVLIHLATQLKEEREQRKALAEQIQRDKPFTEFGSAIAASSDAILVGEFAKLARNNGIVIGQNRLFRWLRENGYLMDDNKPYQKYVDQGLFVMRESSITTIKGNMVRTTTLITGKGQMVLMDRLQKTA